MVRYFGLHANAHRGKVGKSEEDEHRLLIIEKECPRIPPPRLGRLIKRGTHTEFSGIRYVSPVLDPLPHMRRLDEGRRFP